MNIIHIAINKKFFRFIEGVTETSADYDFAGSFEYRRANGSQYLYDANGSLIADKSRGIAYVTRDAYNNPRRIYFTDGSQTRYKYSATGEKLLVEHYVASPNVTVPFGAEPDALTQGQVMYAGSTQYLLGGSLVVKDGLVDRYLFDGGYAKATSVNPTTYTFEFYYYNRDHLGNNREVVDASGTVQQVTNYYPFGTPYADTEAVMNANMQPYKYNGKELDRMHGLDTYDYGARQYDPVTARWDRVDQLAERKPWQSPYVYGRNNPIRYIDPDGNDDWDKLVGNVVGTITNIFPFAGFARDLHSPTDDDDYNTALRTTDNAWNAIGEGMIKVGKGGTVIGMSITATSSVVVVGSGGTAAGVGAPAAAAGATIAEASAATGLLGALIKMNVESNKSGGYNRGGQKSSTRNTDRHYNQKKKEVHKNILDELRNLRKKMKNMQRTPDTRRELKQLDKRIKHEERKSHDTGETHHRR